jgi:hypothetical protein
MELAGWLVGWLVSYDWRILYRTKRQSDANIKRNVEDVNHGSVTWLPNGKICDDVNEFWIQNSKEFLNQMSNSELLGSADLLHTAGL